MLLRGIVHLQHKLLMVSDEIGVAIVDKYPISLGLFVL